MLKRLKKQAKKLFVAGVLLTALLTPVVVAQADLYIVATADNGSYIGLSCGSSAGNFRYIYFADTDTYMFYDAYPGDCP